MTDDFAALPPCDIQAEMAVLGAILQSADALAEVATILDPGDFYRPAHIEVYATARAMADRGETVDPITMVGALGERLATVGGAPYMHTLMQAPPAIGSATSYARIVAGHAVRRRTLQAGHRIVQAANDLGYGPGQLVELANAAVSAVDPREVTDDRPLSELGFAALDAIEKGGTAANGLGTGFTDLDDVLEPMMPGQLITVAARPGIGKSTIAADIARHVAFTLGPAVLFVSLEMTSEELTQRILSAESRVPVKAMKAGEVHDDASWQRLARAQERMGCDRLHIRYRPGASLATVRALCRQLRPAITIVDYLQLMTPGPGDSRQEQVAALSRGLKLLAQEEQTTLIVPCQLNRGPENRSDHRPGMSDIRESGAVEQDSDVVLLLHRPEAYNPEERAGEVDVIVAKQRAGTAGVSRILASQLHYCRFSNIALHAL